MRQCYDERGANSTAVQAYPGRTRFPFEAVLESQWRSIRAEVEALPREKFRAWPAKYEGVPGWDAFGLYLMGRKLRQGCELCPRTADALCTIPGLKTAGFSSLQPGTHIKPHVGFSSEVLRCHLGLIVPSGCSMRIGTEIVHWREGECLVFDDTVEHEVWHRGDSPRVILLIDFERPA